MLEDRGGREDGYKIARDLSFKFSDLLKVMKAAEILGLVSTPAGDVVLEPLGREFLAADMNTRKRIIREQLQQTFAVQLLRAAAARPGRSLADQGSGARTSRDALAG